MGDKTVLSLTLVLAGALTACGTVNGPPSEYQRLVRSLTASCIDANGGARMDAVGLYGGNLSVACLRWAHRRAKQAALYPPWPRDDSGVVTTSAEGQNGRKP